jgi:hypothetical protein
MAFVKETKVQFFRFKKHNRYPTGSLRFDIANPIFKIKPVRFASLLSSLYTPIRFVFCIAKFLSKTCAALGSVFTTMGDINKKYTTKD